MVDLGQRQKVIVILAFDVSVNSFTQRAIIIFDSDWKSNFIAIAELCNVLVYQYFNC
jgi:hypothetical protein